MKHWFLPEDEMAPVIEARRMIAGKYPGRELSSLPPKAVFFVWAGDCLYWKKHFPPSC